MKFYIDWADVPADLKARSQWQLLNQRIRKGEKPIAEIKTTKEKKIRKFQPSDDDEVKAGDKLEEPLTLEVENRIGLFSASQTVPFIPTPLENARRAYFHWFVEASNPSHYLWRTDDDWQWCDGFLGRSKTRSHVSGSEEYGVIGGGRRKETTRFGLIDLDLHRGDQEVFLAQLEVLLSEFHDRDGWHLQVKNQDASGVHLIQVISSVNLRNYRNHLRNRLMQLDKRFPDLAEKARRSGMKTLGEIEIYPDTCRGVRLPLARNRTILLDRPLELVANRKKRLVQDVVGYARWIVDKSRAYMPTSEIIKFVKDRLEEPTQKFEDGPTTISSTKSRDASDRSVSSGLLNQFRVNHRTWPQFVFWLASNGLPCHDSFGEATYELAKWLVHVELSHLELPERRDRAIALLNDYAATKHNGFVSRLAHGQEDEVSSQITRIVSQAEALPTQYQQLLAKIRESQDSGKYLKVLAIASLLDGKADTPLSTIYIPSTYCSIYLSLQVLKERGLLDDLLPDKIQMIIAAKKGRQKMDLFARRFLNALFYSPDHRRLISYADIYQMMDEAFRQDASEKPTTASQYLKTLIYKTRLVAKGATYRKGERATEYVLQDEGVELIKSGRADYEEADKAHRRSPA